MKIFSKNLVRILALSMVFCLPAVADDDDFDGGFSGGFSYQGVDL